MSCIGLKSAVSDTSHSSLRNSQYNDRVGIFEESERGAMRASLGRQGGSSECKGLEADV